MKPQIISISTKGKQTLFPNNLTGKPFDQEIKKISIPLPLIKLKKTIIDKFIIPIHQDNWKTVKENFFLLDRIDNKINKYKIHYNNHDLEIYEHLVTFIKDYYDIHNDFESLEKKMYGSNQNKNNLATLVYKTPKIRMKVEYEIYHLIFGKPNKKNKETYNVLHLNRIKDLLKNDDITFDKIKKEVGKYAQ